MRMAIATMLAMLASTSIAQTAPPHLVASPFERMSSRDGDVHGVRGAGCVWSDRKDEGHPRDATWLIGMADDRAVVKRDGRYVMLRPLSGAKDMGPFTFDRWTGSGMTLLIRRHGRVVRVGTAYDQPARLAFTEAGRTTTYAGTVNCGT